MGSIISGITGGISGNSGAAGVNYQAGAAPLIQSATTDQANNTYAQQQAALQAQQNFVGATQAQNGLGNQSSVYNQLQGVTNGTGPNPAQAQLAQSTGANVANQASLMAGQRGSSANAGLIARQAAQQGAATQQSAAGQAATLQANQSLNALNSQGSLATSQANQQANALQGQNQAAQAGQSATLGAIGAQNNASVSSVGSQNSANSSIASKTATNQADLFGGALAGAGTVLGLAAGGKVQSGSPTMNYAEGTPPGGAAAAPVTTQLNAPSSAPKSAFGQYLKGTQQPQQQQAAEPESALHKGASQWGKAAANAGKSAYNYLTTPSATPLPTQAVAGGPSDSDSNTPSMPADGSDQGFQLSADGGVMQNVAQLAPILALAAAKGGKVPVLLSPGERKLSPAEAKAAAGGKIDPMKAGEKVPGKPKVGGAKNSYANDTHKDAVEPGTLILPRSVTQAKHPHWAAMKFVQQHMAMAKGGKVK